MEPNIPPFSTGVSTTSGSVSSLVTASLTATAVVGVIVEEISWSHGVVVSLHAEYISGPGADTAHTAKCGGTTVANGMHNPRISLGLPYSPEL